MYPQITSRANRRLGLGLYLLLGLSAGLMTARADPVADVITGSLQIGAMDLATGAFTPSGLHSFDDSVSGSRTERIFINYGFQR